MYDALKQAFFHTFHKQAAYIFSAPGRTELSGNHTDHQLGRVLAGAVNVESLAAVTLSGGREIRVLSEGYPMCTVSLDSLDPRPEEKETTAALIRGVAAGFAQRGFAVPAFDACVCSGIQPGSGLSSSAAFEVLIGTVINCLGGCGLGPVEIARIGQRAENLYFGKPCGLMDQTASAVGNIIAIDFADAEAPLVEPIGFDFSRSGHALCIIDSGASHADLTADYASIPLELKALCRVFGKERLRQIPEALFYSRINEARAAAGDRAVLRAIHVYDENRRVLAQTEALKAGDFPRFLSLAAESGRSSWMYLQNVIPAGSAAHQELAFALAVAEKLLAGRGACRVHGGGFAGTIQAFVPEDMLEAFKEKIDAVLGAGSCRCLSIRPQGGVLVEEV